MSKLKYILRTIKRMNFKNMFKVARKVAKKSHKLTIYILIDMVICGFKYGAGYYDYQEFEFYNLKKDERKTYLTRTKNNLIIRTFNNKESFHKFDNKEEFNKLFKSFLKRDYLVINENSYDEFIKFIDKHNPIIVKPLDGEGGKGVEKYEIDNECNLEALFNTLLVRKQYLIEECINQNDIINSLYSDSVNTLRLFTFYNGKDVVVLNSVFKIGNGGVTDNFSSGSMYTFTDDKGVVLCPAIDQDDNEYTIHPITNKLIVGFEIPFYKEACTMVKKAAKVVPDIKYVGWDVAITNKGPVIVEGNSFPGVFQMKPSFSKEHIGLIPKYQKYMDIDLN